MLILEVIQGPEKGRRFELPDDEPQMIGRSSESLPLSDPTISRRHAELTPNDGRWIIRDLQSANGVYVNGQRIARPAMLSGGDQVRCGKTLMVFGRAPGTARRPIHMVGGDRMDAEVEKSAPSNDDSLVMAVPEPSAAALDHLRVVYDLMRLVGSSFDRRELFERVMDLIFEHFQADRGFILLHRGSHEQMEPMVVRHRLVPRDAQQPPDIRVSRTIVQHVMEHAEGVLSSNAMTDRRFSAGDSVQALGIRSAICVPIQFREQTFGVIHIDSQVANYTFTEDQLRLLTAVGAQAGLALENVRLYEQEVHNARMAAVGETVANVSHSIKNILQAMRGGAEVVELGLRKADLQIIGNGWDILSRNLDRIYQLTMNMLAYSKQREPEVEMTQLPTLLREVAELVQSEYDQRQVALITDLDDQMPPIPVDGSGIHQAAMNLLTNALEAAPEQTGAVTLRCEYDPSRELAVLSVSDNGAGIETDDPDRVFTPFYSTKGQRGTGLGLAVTRKIVQEHGGRIHARSEQGRGTTFIIELPGEQERDPGETDM